MENITNRRKFIGELASIALATTLVLPNSPKKAQAQQISPERIQRIIGGKRSIIKGNEYEKSDGLKITSFPEKDFVLYQDPNNRHTGFLFIDENPMILFQGEKGQDFIGVGSITDGSTRVEFSKKNSYGFNDSAYFSTNGIIRIYPVRRSGREVPLVEIEPTVDFLATGGSGTAHFDANISGRISSRSSIPLIERQRGVRESSANFFFRVYDSEVEHELRNGNFRTYRNPDLREPHRYR